MPVKWEIVDIFENREARDKVRSEGFVIGARLLDNVYLNMIDLGQIKDLLKAWVLLRTGLETRVEIWGSRRSEWIEFICWYGSEQIIEVLKPTITFKRTILEE